MTGFLKQFPIIELKRNGCGWEWKRVEKARRGVGRRRKCQRRRCEVFHLKVAVHNCVQAAQAAQLSQTEENIESLFH